MNMIEYKIVIVKLEILKISVSEAQAPSHADKNNCVSLKWDIEKITLNASVYGYCTR